MAKRREKTKCGPKQIYSYSQRGTANAGATNSGQGKAMAAALNNLSQRQHQQREQSVPIKKDTYLNALISGFSGQRVALNIKSILYGGKILPVKLEAYDLGGLAGLYVPERAFRDFTKDPGNNTIQGGYYQ
jgi:hypothetical protein